MPMKKFQQALDPEQYKEMEKQAKMRKITVQELLRTVVIPEWTRLMKWDKESVKAVLGKETN